MFTVSNNLRIINTKKMDVSKQFSVQKSVHSRYNDSGILRKCENEKSLNSLRIEAFLSGVDETRTRDLLRDRQAF